MHYFRDRNGFDHSDRLWHAPAPLCSAVITSTCSLLLFIVFLTTWGSCVQLDFTRLSLLLSLIKTFPHYCFNYLLPTLLVNDSLLSSYPLWTSLLLTLITSFCLPDPVAAGCSCLNISASHYLFLCLWSYSCDRMWCVCLHCSAGFADLQSLPVCLHGHIIQTFTCFSALLLCVLSVLACLLNWTVLTDMLAVTPIAILNITTNLSCFPVFVCILGSSVCVSVSNNVTCRWYGLS